MRQQNDPPVFTLLRQHIGKGTASDERVIESLHEVEKQSRIDS
jgi:hypothetical protein